MANFHMNSEGIRPYLIPHGDGRTVLQMRLGDDEYRLTFRRCPRPGTHTDPPEPGAACTPDEVAELAARVFTACTAAAR